MRLNVEACIQLGDGRFELHVHCDAELHAVELVVDEEVLPGWYDAEQCAATGRLTLSPIPDALIRHH